MLRVHSSRRLALAAVAAGAALSLAGATPALAQYSTQVLADNPVAYYRLNEAAGSTSATDLAPPAGANNAAQEGGTVAFGVPSLINEPGSTAARFSDSAAVGNGRLIAPAFDKIGTGFTVEYWIRPTAMPTNCCSPLVSDGDGADGDGFFMMNYIIGPGQGTTGDIRPHYSRVNSPLSSAPNDSTLALVNGQTYHVVTTWDASAGSPATNNANIYINGVLDSSFTVTKNFDPANENNPLFLGRDNRAGYAGADFVLDEVALYDYALSAARVTAHYQVGVVPEPAAVSLLGLGALGLLARRRRA